MVATRANVGAFSYLLLHTWRNRALAMVRRVRKPQYALGLVAVTAYFLFFAWGNGSTHRPGGVHLFQGDMVRPIAPLILALILIPSWFLGNANQALAFTLPEVSLLFPAPVSRRTLILYKLAGAQVPIMFNVLIWTYVFRLRSATLPQGLALLAMWVMFSTVYLHRLGAALVRASTLAHGRAAAKRNWAAQVFAIAVPAIIIVTFLSSAGSLRDASGASDFGHRLADLLAQPMVRMALFPFTLIVTPTFAVSVATWIGPMAVALGVLMLHVMWVVRTNVAFEEAAAEASERRQAMLESLRRRGVAAQPAGPSAGQAVQRSGKAKRTLPLAATGAPLVAIIWKNVLTLWRTIGRGGALVLVAGPVLLAGLASGKAKDPGVIVAFVCGAVALVLAMLGNVGARSDLRADLLNLSILKTMPLRGSEIVLAEVVSYALPLALVQYVLVLVGLAGLQASQHAAPADIVVALGAAMPFGLIAINLAFGTLRNGTAVLFPGWAQLGTTAPQGFEVMGQALIGAFAAFLAFAVLMIAPTFVALFVGFATHLTGGAALAVDLVVGGAAVAGECYAIMLWLGRVLERLEPSQVG